MNTVWYELWLSQYCSAVTLWNYYDMNSEKYFTIVWFVRNSMKKSLLLDINSENVCSIVCQWLSENVSIAWCKLLSRVSAPPEILTSPLFTWSRQKYYMTWLPLWNVPLSKKTKIHFLKKQNILFPAIQ